MSTHLYQNILSVFQTTTISFSDQLLHALYFYKAFHAASNAYNALLDKKMIQHNVLLEYLQESHYLKRYPQQLYLLNAIEKGLAFHITQQHSLASPSLSKKANHHYSALRNKTNPLSAQNIVYGRQRH